MTAAEDVDINQLAELITSDPALTTKILKTVNSSFYGLSKNVSTVSQALVILGLRSVKTLVLGFSLVRNMRSHEDGSFDYPSYWRQSIYAAVAARAIGVEVRLVEREEAFLAALLQNVGMPMLHTVLGEQYDQLVQESGPDHETIFVAEAELLGITHAEVAAFILGDWKLPPLLSEPVANHHTPEASPEALKPLTRVVHLAGLCAEVFMDHVTPPTIQKAKDYAWQQFAVSEKAFTPLMAKITEDMKEIAKLFEVSVGEHRGYDEIFARANEQLMQLSLLSQQQATDMETKVREFEEQANTDALTGIANRKRFTTQLRNEFVRASRFNRPLAMIFVDADRFKKINDTYGHDVGDAVLVYLARTMQDVARPDDLVARYGGEEFVILLSETKLPDAIGLAESIRHAVEAAPFRHDGLEIPITVSAGVAATVGGTPYEDEKAFFRSADAAVYLAKENGRNRVETATVDEQEAA